MPVTLDGSGSSDPNGDMLVYTWTRGGEELATGVNPTIDLAPGVHDITLKVEDYRDGIDTDTVRITLQAPDIEVDDLYITHPEGGGIAGGTVTVRNLGDKTLNWTVSDTALLDQSDIIREFPVTWVSTYSSSGYPRTMAYDATRDCLWVGYYYDDEVGRIDANNGSNIETKELGSGHRVYALDMDGADLWVADYCAKQFKRFDVGFGDQHADHRQPWRHRIRSIRDRAGLRPVLCRAAKRHEHLSAERRQWCCGRYILRCPGEVQ